MSQSNSTALERLPEGAIQLCQGRIHAFNRAAGAQFPELAVGDQPPAFLAPALGDQTAGVFLHQGVEYVFSRTPQDCCQLLLVHPSSQSALTDRQLDGFVRQMRTFMQEMLLPVQLLSDDLSRAGGDPSGQDAAFQKTFCRMLSNAAKAAPQGSVFLTLLSNAAKAAPQGSVFLTLAQRRDRAILSVTDSGQDFAQEDLDTLFPSPLPDDRIPDPQEGAGMGLAIARHIVALHKGTMLLERRESGSLLSVVSLPTGPLDTRLQVQSPRIEDTGGLSPVLVELSDVLPQSMFRTEDYD